MSKISGGPGLLLSHEDELTFLRESFLPELPHREEIFPSTTAFYDSLGTPDGIIAGAREFYRWLGSKPFKIHLETAEVEKFGFEDHTLSIPIHLKDEPYQLASEVALAILQDVMTRKLAITPTQSLLETASIEVGFGTLLLNGVTQQPSILERWHHGINGTHSHHHILHTYTVQTYALQFATYCHAAKIAHKTLLLNLSENTRLVLPGYYKHHTEKTQKLPVILQKRRHRARLAIMKVIGAALVLSIATIIGLFVYGQRPYKPSKAVLGQYQKTIKLSQDYQLCIQHAKQEQNAYQQNDIFREQAINGELSRCQSLRNQYDYEVTVYNSMLEQQ